jgi:hypothetical protein
MAQKAKRTREEKRREEEEILRIQREEIERSLKAEHLKKMERIKNQMIEDMRIKMSN